MNQEFVKLDRFDGTNFNRWKDKMMFLLSVLNLVYVIDQKTPPIANAAGSSTMEEEEKIVELKKKHDADTIVCRGHMLIQSPLEIWKYLEENLWKRSQTADKSLAGTLMGTLTTIKFDSSRTMYEHVIEMTNIASRLKSLETEVDENFLVQFILNLLPSEYGPFQINYNTMKDK
ncbi:uncharacterized protein [Arachis hypogaea]|uniref:uncharacterized protein n=1 Tax=Arachis hypogaea TaxID=3818 RepID=UPI003B22301A